MTAGGQSRLCAADADWPGFEAREVLPDHVIRYLPRDYELFARLNPGDQYPEAWPHAHEMLEERLAELKTRARDPGLRRIQAPESFDRPSL